MAESDVHKPGEDEALPDIRVGLPEVLIAGRAVEIRGEGAQVVRGILEEWLEMSERRLGYLQGKDPETLRKLRRRIEMVRRVLRAWSSIQSPPEPEEGVLAVPPDDGGTE